MAKYWMMYLGSYVLGGLTIIVADWAYRTYKRRRQARIVARRMKDLFDFAGSVKP